MRVILPYIFCFVLYVQGSVAQENRRILLLSPNFGGVHERYEEIATKIFNKIIETKYFELNRKQAVWESDSKTTKQNYLSQVDYILSSTLTYTANQGVLLLRFLIKSKNGDPLENNRLKMNIVVNSPLSINEAVEKLSEEISHFKIHGKFKKEVVVDESGCTDADFERFKKFLLRSLKTHDVIKKFHVICESSNCKEGIILEYFDCSEEDGEKKLWLTLTYKEKSLDVEESVDEDIKTCSSVIADRISVKLNEFNDLQ